MRRLLLTAAVLVLALAVAGPGVAARPSTSLWAVVNIAGSLDRGTAISSAQLGVDGQYEVVFNRDVSRCAYVAGGGEATAVSPDDAVVFTTAPREANVNAVFVQEWDGVLGVDSYSSGFHLIVVC